MPDLRTLIRRGRDLDQQIKLAEPELKKIKASLIEAGAGEHLGTGGAKANVVEPAPSIKPDAEALQALRKLLPKAAFEKLFEESVQVSPVKAFREIAEAILTPSIASKVIAICEKPGSPRVIFS